MSKVYSKTRLNSDGAVTAVASFILGLHFKDSDESRSIRVTSRSPCWEILNPSEGQWHSRHRAAAAQRPGKPSQKSIENAARKFTIPSLNRCVSANPSWYAELLAPGSHSKFLGSRSLLALEFGGSHWLPRQKMQIHTSEELAKKKQL